MHTYAFFDCRRKRQPKMEKDEKRKKHTSEKNIALIAEKAISARFEVTCKNY